MSRSFLVAINLNKQELQNPRIHNLASAPGTPVSGQVYYDTVANKMYYYNGSAWTDMTGGAVTFGGTGDMSSSAEGDTVSAGASGKVSDAGHRHAREAFGTSAAAIGTSAGGVATTPSKSDHVHATGAGTPSTQAFGDSAVTGSGPAAAMTDHKHAMPAAPAGGTPAVVLGTAGAAGVAATFLRTDDTIAAFDATVAAAIGTAAAGSVAKAARRDHVHPTGAGTPSTQAFSDSAVTGTGPAASMSDHKHAMPAHAAAAHSAIKISDLAAPAADVAWASFKITGLLDPTNPQDAATKAYVDAASAGIDWKASVRVATTATGTLATAYENGDTIDGVTLATGNRILIKDQAAGAENGIYTVNASGAPTRATDADTAGELTSGTAVFVEEGTVNADTGWVMTNNGAITLGTTALVFAQFTSLGQITAGAGLTKTGSTLDVIGGNGITVAADLVSVDSAVVVRKYAQTFGDNSAVSFAISHGLATTDVTVQVFQVSDGAQVEPDITRTSSSVVTLAFAVAPTTNQYRVVVHG